MNIPPAAWPLIMFALALFLVSAVRRATQGKGLERDPFWLLGMAVLVLGAMLFSAVQDYMKHPSTAGGVSQLEQVQVCQTPSNLAGCAGRGYASQPIDAAHDIPVDGVPMTVRPTPLWANSPGGPP